MTTGSLVDNNVKSGIKYILDNRQYPDFIRSHAIFSNLKKINKIFPKIGLPNTVEECQYDHDDAKLIAAELLVNSVRKELVRLLEQSALGKTRSLVNDLYYQISSYYNYMVTKEEDKKVAIKFFNNCCYYEGKDFFKKGESFFKGYNKFSEEIKKTTGLEVTPLEKMESFKSFSASNVTGNTKLIFSSNNEDGAWDIATISMRGINSCQTWGTAQSRGLIGSIASYFVGVIYLTSGSKINDFGTKMIRRSLVRYCIHKDTKKSALLVDKIYPSDDNAARKLFRDFLIKKTKLPVLFPTDPEWKNYILPKDKYHLKVNFQVNEFTYMDTKIPIGSFADKKIIDTGKFIDYMDNDNYHINQNVYNAIIKKFDEYRANKQVNKEEFKGGVANLIGSFQKRQIALLYNKIPKINPSLDNVNNYSSYSEYKKSLIKLTIKNTDNIKKILLRDINHSGGFMKFYTKSSERLVNLIISEFKKELFNHFKNSIKNP